MVVVKRLLLRSYFVMGWLLILAASRVESAEYPGEFVQNTGGVLSTRGLSWESSTPARIVEPGFGIAYARISSVDVRKAGLAGEFGLGDNRIAFSSDYMEMDSLYRQVYTELDFSFRFSWLVLGAGYGLTVEWIPAEENWNRHRYKSGVTFLWNGFSVGGLVAGWCDQPIAKFDYSLGSRFEIMDRFSVFMEWNGTSFDVGNAVRFRLMQISAAYRFPDFGVAISVDLLLGDWSIGSSYGFVGLIWDWFGFSVSRKKTIL